MTRWTSEMDATLLRMHGRHTHAEIGKVFGKTPRAIEARVSALGISRAELRRIDPDYDRAAVSAAFNAWRAPAPAQLSWRV